MLVRTLRVVVDDKPERTPGERILVVIGDKALPATIVQADDDDDDRSAYLAEGVFDT